MADPRLSSPRIALILAGGVAKGAFEAGALEVLVERGLSPEHIIACSSGALNGAFLAGALRAGREAQLGELSAMWEHEADWRHAFDLSLSGLIHGSGLSTSDKLRALVERELGKLTGPTVRPVQLQLVVAPIRGVAGRIGRHAATTFEQVLRFSADDFADEAGRSNVARAVTASAAFPGVFEPVDLPGLGPTYDGGVVNDTPVKLALHEGTDRIVVIAPYPLEVKPRPTPTGVALVLELADVLIHERLYRDLHDTERVNGVLERLDGLVASGKLSSEQRDEVAQVLGWRRRIELLHVRPDEALPGNAFAGLFDCKLRRAYVEAGRKAAVKALAD